jgi:hypothetical protein
MYQVLKMSLGLYGSASLPIGAEISFILSWRDKTDGKFFPLCVQSVHMLLDPMCKEMSQMEDREDPA